MSVWEGTATETEIFGRRGAANVRRYGIASESGLSALRRSGHRFGARERG